MNEFGYFYHDETNQPPNEQGPVVKNNELVHLYLVKQGYFQVKYKFTKLFHLLDNLTRQHRNQLNLNYLIFNVIFTIIDNFMIFSI